MPHTTRVVVYTVDVIAREDSIYVFTNEDDAERFARAVRRGGGDCILTEQAVRNRAETDALIASELADEQF